MAQGLMLLKELPDENYLHDLQERGHLRASMSFIAGGCYAGAGLYNATTSYVTSDAPTVEAMCPNPADQAGCLIWELMERVRKVSNAMPGDFNAFLFVERDPGTSDEYRDLVLRLGGEDDGTTGFVESDRGRLYVASADLLGCGSYNTVVEVLADDHDQLLEVLHGLTEVPYVREYALGRLRAEDTRGFGEGDG